MKGTVSGRCSTAWNELKSPVNQKCCFLLFMLCYKDMQHRSKHHPWAWRNRPKLNSIPLWYLLIQYNNVIPKIAALQHISTKLNFRSWWTGLLSGPCSLVFARCTNLDMYCIHARLEAKSFYTIHTYIHFALQLHCCAGLRLKTKTDINRCLNVIQYIKLTKKRAPTKDPDSKIHLYRPYYYYYYNSNNNNNYNNNYYYY